MDKKQVITLNESQLEALVQECVKSFLNEESNEGFLRNMIQGYRQGRQDYKAAQQPYKDATKQAKTNSRQTSQLAKKYGRHIDKDIQAVKDILERYKDYPSIERSSRFITGALGKLKAKMNAEAQNAQNQYNTAKQQQQANKEQLDANMVQGVRNAVSGGVGQGQQNQQYSQVG